MTMTTLLDIDFGAVAEVEVHHDAPNILVVCEHASNRVPDALDDLGVTEDVLQSHVAWDPGAAPVAQELAKRLSACYVLGGVSRLVYDCNRPPEAPSAMPEQSEIYTIPGNAGLSEESKTQRIEGVYIPFCKSVEDQISRYDGSLALLVTIHSFNPVYNGQPRAVELGVLHGKDASFAEAMLRNVPSDLPYAVKLNAPYSAADGVAHSIDKHGSDNQLPNVMIEIRNDLVTSENDQMKCAEALADWITATARAEGLLS